MVWNGPRLLVFDVSGSSGLVGVRPLGGSIEFGETREDALHREFWEELGTPIRITGPWFTFENIFLHGGVAGHEYLFAAIVELENQELYHRDEILFHEQDGTPCLAKWRNPDTLYNSGLELYPKGLGSVLINQ